MKFYKLVKQNKKTMSKVQHTVYNWDIYLTGYFNLEKKSFLLDLNIFFRKHALYPLLKSTIFKRALNFKKMYNYFQGFCLQTRRKLLKLMDLIS